MKADLGGTEIYGALSVTLSSRSLDVPTAVFVLTDGEVRFFLVVDMIHFDVDLNFAGYECRRC